MTTPAPIGLVPAAGYARRLGPMPVSKEVFPLGVGRADDNGTSRLQVPIDSLLRAFCAAGAERAYVVLREGKWDVPAYLTRGDDYDLSLAYLVTPPTLGVPFTMDRATPFVQDATVLFGFPDIVFEPRNVFVQLLRRQDETNADLVLGLFPARDPSKVDMVDFDEEGHIRSLVIKPDRTTLTHTWLIAVWRPTFTRFLHEHVQRRLHQAPMDDAEEYVGHVIEAALDTGLDARAVPLDNAAYADIGTLDTLQAVLRSMARAHPPVSPSAPGS